MKQVSRRTFLATSGTTGLGLLAGNRSMRAQERETLNIGLSPFINQATIFMANDLGYFSKMGLDIRMKIFMDGALVVAPMLSGESKLA
jgi:ABC-type nitrate/sulfonate/bicarbonate transport system substrate-binding protein